MPALNKTLLNYYTYFFLPFSMSFTLPGSTVSPELKRGRYY